MSPSFWTALLFGGKTRRYRAALDARARSRKGVAAREVLFYRTEGSRNLRVRWASTRQRGRSTQRRALPIRSQPRQPLSRDLNALLLRVLVARRRHTHLRSLEQSERSRTANAGISIYCDAACARLDSPVPSRRETSIRNSTCWRPI